MWCICVFVCFFCKQKTAYEVRISDWSSDVCSSDLRAAADDRAAAGAGAKLGEGHSDRHRFLSLFPLRGAPNPRRPRSLFCLAAKGQSFVNASMALTAFACPRVGKDTRIQP